ncbi:hypothetical protein J2752_001067 [Halarchaeum rubridurum]|uniref:Archaeal Type IV pilin N-terminal domain-containing protein n=1 Tax=Halarchaeum rubridurum TaxID=489911 RepID=A0A830FXW9_9EURY|nr:type IV pilin N-terminal domain-containing protein [Halarchaeum rubridurum]MBP1954186.1 hypothetical protein [Halarchaeum rubridurum]GGM58004.1 hypothetical protein GCM10009017_05220 [Halarchaeum rubridurum]
MSAQARGLAPVVGTLLLLACCVATGGVVAASLADTGGGLAAPTPAVFDLAASADGTVALTYRSGPPLDVTDLAVTVTVDGRPLRHQPAPPFVGRRGFDGAPAGPFNAASDPTWRAGERATFRVARTNVPRVRAGDRLTVRLARAGRPLATVRTRVAPAQPSSGTRASVVIATSGL